MEGEIEREVRGIERGGRRFEREIYIYIEREERESGER